MAEDQLWKAISEKLREQGIDLEELCSVEGISDRMKVVCIAPNLSDSIREVSGAPRDQVIMARVSGETAETLDAWIAAGAARSRSEAAALFIREGLKVRADELEKLRGALKEVQEARERLSKQAREIFEAEK